MIWRLLICFSLLAWCCSGASIKGQIVVVDNAKNSKQANAKGTVVWLEAAQDDVELPRAEPLRLRMLQKNKTFEPHILAAPVGSSIDFPNLDPIFHNAFSNYDGQIFDLGLYAPMSSRSVAFRRPGVVRVFCNIHSSMSAVIVVIKSPYYAVSDEEGKFTIRDVPAGAYRVVIYHERATEQTLAAIIRRIDVDDSTKDLGALRISESGYLPIPHLNKYGKSYPSQTESGSYPGARQ